MTTTIAAIATAQAPGGIGVIRISGPSAFFIAKTLFFTKNPLDWSKLTHHAIAYGTIHAFPSPQKEEISSKIDDIICLVFPAPRSYTGEDVVEFQCHGGLAVLRRALNAVFAAGAVPAEPGEFTRRAFLNGRIDLAKAEAVMQLVSAGSEQAARAASAALGGALSKQIETVRNQLISIQAHISAWVDYPDDDIPALHSSELTETLTNSISSLQSLLRKAPRDQLMLSGINTALLGKPNVGKSSLMNLLAGYDRSIVTNIPGTTRDTITETIALGNLSLRLTDTAGIHETEDSIEAAGVARSQAALAQAELILLVCDASQPLDDEDVALLQTCDPTRTILVYNKCDLGVCVGATVSVARGTPGTVSPTNLPLRTVNISAKTGQGLPELTSAIETMLDTSNFSPGEAILANQRQQNCASQALQALEEAFAAQKSGYPLDAVSVCIEDAVAALFSLTGERASDAIVNEVFAQFCVGK